MIYPFRTLAAFDVVAVARELIPQKRLKARTTRVCNTKCDLQILYLSYSSLNPS